MLRAGDHLARLPRLQDDSLVHEQERVAHLSGETDLMGHDDHRHAGFRQLPHHVEHLPDELSVQGRGGLVEQHQLRLHRQRPGDRHPLLLAAGELVRIDIGLSRQPDTLQ